MAEASLLRLIVNSLHAGTPLTSLSISFTFSLPSYLSRSHSSELLKASSDLFLIVIFEDEISIWMALKNRMSADRVVALWVALSIPTWSDRRFVCQVKSPILMSVIIGANAVETTAMRPQKLLDFFEEMIAFASCLVLLDSRILVLPIMISSSNYLVSAVCILPRNRVRLSGRLIFVSNSIK